LTYAIPEANHVDLSRSSSRAAEWMNEHREMEDATEKIGQPAVPIGSRVIHTNIKEQ
jgi:hypothetical protein